MKIKIEPKILKDAFTVIGIAMVLMFAALPFEKYVPQQYLKLAGHYSTIVGYLWLCYKAKKVEVKHLVSVAVVVWIIMMAAYTMMFWNLIGTKYTVKGIVCGGFLFEAISVFVGCICYVAGREFRYYYKYYLRGDA